MIVSCGDSFFFGTDLDDPQDVWPAQVAKVMGHDYRSLAQPGVGNLRILQQILEAQALYGTDAIYAVNWSWIDRFDYVAADDAWHTTRPSVEDSTADPIYYRHFHSELADKFRSLICVSQAIQTLQGHRYIMTYMDDLLMDQRWHSPVYVRTLQHQVSFALKTFGGRSFLQWSRDRGFAESDHWHPLKPAHTAAANYWLPEYQRL